MTKTSEFKITQTIIKYLSTVDQSTADDKNMTDFLKKLGRRYKFSSTVMC